MPHKEGLGEQKERQTPSVDVLEHIKQSYLKELPIYKDLPNSFSIDKKVAFMDEANFEQTIKGDMSIGQIADELDYLHGSLSTEFSCSLVITPDGALKFGPIIQGTENSVPISAPLKRVEMQTPSGLYVYRDEVIAAVIHSHGPDHKHSFSLQDIYQHFNDEGQPVSQMYVIRDGGVIDMAQKTVDSKLISRDTFARLATLWSDYLQPNGLPRFEKNHKKYNEFIQRILKDTLKLGFYSNQNSDNVDKLIKM